MELRGPGLICLHPTPDLNFRWQALIVTERSPLSLEETALFAMGFHYIRRESDVAEWESEDWRVKRAHVFYAEPLAQFKLTLAQKVLLMYNTMHIQSVPRQNVPGTKRPRDKTSQGQNVPRDKTSQGTKRPKDKTSQGDK